MKCVISSIQNTQFRIRCTPLKYSVLSSHQQHQDPVVQLKNRAPCQNKCSAKYFVFTISGRDEDGSSVTDSLHWLVSSSQLRTGSR